MFGWLKRTAGNAIANSGTTDIDRFVLGLKGSTSTDIARIVALTAHWRNHLEEKFGWDLDHPNLVAMEDSGATRKLHTLLRQVQKQSPAMTEGLVVWVHTLQASRTPEIRMTGREMWRELARGVPFAAAAAEELNQIASAKLDTKGIDRVPANFRAL